MPVEFFIVLFMLIGSAFFSGVETALLGLGPLNLIRGDQKRLYRLYLRKDRLISACLIGNNLTIVAATLALDSMLPEDGSIALKILAFFIQVGVFFFLAEALPKTVLRRLDLWVLQVFYPLLRFFDVVFWPLSSAFLGFTSLLFKLLPDERGLRREDLFHFIGSQFQDEHSQFTRSIMSLGQTTAREVMIPLPEIYSLEAGMTLKQAQVVLEETSYSRYPVYQERGDNITGYVQVSDFLDLRGSSRIDKVVKPPVFVPETLPADQLLIKMQNEKLPIVFVVNEYGSVAGLVTLENIAEELVGEIVSNEQAQEAPDIIPADQITTAAAYHGDIKISDDHFLLDGNLDIDDFCSHFSVSVDKQGFETITGYLAYHLGRIPEQGERIETETGIFQITEADERTIHQILYHPVSG